MNSIRLRPGRILLATWLTLAGTGFALATDANSNAQARYQQEMAVCNSGQSNQDANTCRIEARNALAEARRGGLQDAPDRYAQNARQRCADLKDSERRDCEARVRGEGLVEGSVAGGGLLKESVTTHPVQ